MRSVRYRRSYDDIVLAGVPIQQNLERGEKRHEQGSVVLPTKRFKGPHQSDGQRHRPTSASIGLQGRARLIGRQLQDRRRIRQPLCPVRQKPLELGSFKPLSLPETEISVLNRKLRERRGSTVTKR